MELAVLTRPGCSPLHRVLPKHTRSRALLNPPSHFPPDGARHPLGAVAHLPHRPFGKSFRSLGCGHLPSAPSGTSTARGRSRSPRVCSSPSQCPQHLSELTAFVHIRLLRRPSFLTVSPTFCPHQLLKHCFFFAFCVSRPPSNPHLLSLSSQGSLLCLL